MLVEVIIDVMAFSCVVAAICVLLYAWLYTATLAHNDKFNDFFESRRATLIVFAHPDDEVMFFLPAIKNLLKSGHPIVIACLSTGDADNLGQVREAEYHAVMDALKIKNRYIINSPKLVDGFHYWDSAAVQEVVECILNKHPEIDTVMTFDESGVSGHPNHISVRRGVFRIPQEITILELITVPTVMKYVVPPIDFLYTAPSFSFPTSLPTDRNTALGQHQPTRQQQHLSSTVRNRASKSKTYTKLSTSERENSESRGNSPDTGNTPLIKPTKMVTSTKKVGQDQDLSARAGRATHKSTLDTSEDHAMMSHISCGSMDMSCYELMNIYESQMVWFRRLYAIFSRYAFFNSFSITHKPVSFSSPKMINKHQQLNITSN